MRRLRSERGSSLLEMAIVGPLLFMLVLGGMDLSLVVHRSLAAGNAAHAAAAAAARALAGESLDGVAPPLAATQAAETAARRFGALLPGAQVRLSWVGPVRQAQRPLPPYRFVFPVDRVRNVGQTVDWTHNHQFSYAQPQLVNVWLGVNTTPTMTYGDVTADPRRGLLNLGHSHAYLDRYNQPLFGGLQGWAVFAIFMFLAPGTGSGAGVVFGTGSYPYAYGTTDLARTSSWANVTAEVQGSSTPYTRTGLAGGNPFWTADRRTDPLLWPVAVGQTTPAGGPVTVGPYAVRAGTSDVTVESPRAAEIIERRGLRVQITVPVAAFTPWLRPLFLGREIVREGVVHAERVR